ncbi:MAG: 2,3,4,5-tetrahydropyridine-2,6-dicarboxylate N-succinyltransferase [Planctomycetes bacterium]|nr:2,3,4,5-tetrahydropyridine-2,6-dicarboxylate N-succinyltransferase [Planctomycetota bacterium]
MSPRAAIDPEALQDFYARPYEAIAADSHAEVAHLALLGALERGELRAARRDEDGGWQPVAWVKHAILCGFRRTSLVAIDDFGIPAIDKSAYPPRRFAVSEGIRQVPGGSAVRRGAYLARGVVLMPPCYVNVGAYVDAETMVDSHALVGSCAQIGKRVHLSAGAQIGGVLEPAGARPVVVEDECFLGALSGVFEGVLVRARAVLASGVVLTASTVIHDLVRERSYRGEVPEGAVLVPGTRRASGSYAERHGLALAAPLIVKYRDERTAAATALEEALR